MNVLFLDWHKSWKCPTLWKGFFTFASSANKGGPEIDNAVLENNGRIAYTTHSFHTSESNNENGIIVGLKGNNPIGEILEQWRLRQRPFFKRNILR